MSVALAPGHTRRPSLARVITVLAIATAVIAIAALMAGAATLSPARVLAALGRGLGLELEGSHRDDIIVCTLRLPRVVLALAVGAALASAGALLQGLVRNPLADPGLLGVTNGAALAAVAFLVLGDGLLVAAPGALRPYVLPLCAFGGALVATALVVSLARVLGRGAAADLVLIGVGVAALCGAATGLLLFVASDAQLRSVTFWTLGSLGGAGWDVVVPVAVATALAIALAAVRASSLDRLLLGDAEARHLGVDVRRLTAQVAVVVALAIGAAVAVCGVIGFIGLVVPHLLRAWVGPGHRALVPASALGGAALLTAADAVARTIVAPAELPVGIVTALVGAPVLIAIARTRSAA